MVGYGVDSDTLVDQMVATVDSAASLPLLQFTARLLWDRRDRSARQIRQVDYDAIGGVEGALAKHADDILAGLAPAELATTRSLFMRLVTPPTYPPGGDRSRSARWPGRRRLLAAESIDQCATPDGTTE